MIADYPEQGSRIGRHPMHSRSVELLQQDTTCKDAVEEAT
jgi:hypothetical protein